MSKGTNGGKSRRAKKPEPPLILIANTSKDDVYAGIDPNYFPDIEAGDEVQWSNDGKFVRISAKCKGCKEKFETTTFDQLLMYILHCIQMCDEYKKLNLIRHCYPCDKYCMDVQAFLLHSSDTDCPAHEYLTLKKRS